MQSIGIFIVDGCFAMWREFLNGHGETRGSHNRDGIQPTAGTHLSSDSCGEDAAH